MTVSLEARELDVDSLPAVPSQQQVALLKELASVAPAMPAPASQQHLDQCLRVLDAALPSRNKDEVGGKLMRAAYHRMLASYPKDAVDFAMEQGLRRFRWFPTISELTELMKEWHRSDWPWVQHHKAVNRLREESQRRRSQLILDLAAGKVSSDTIAAMPDWMVQDLRRAGALAWNAEACCFEAVLIAERLTDASE